MRTAALFFLFCMTASAQDASQIANACIQRALASPGKTCDLSNLTDPNTLSEEIDVGDAAGDAVTLILPSKFTWTSTAAFTGGKSCLIKQFSYSYIKGQSGELRGLIQNGSGDGAILSLYCNNGPGYYRAENFALYNPKYATASGIAMSVSGSYDNSMFRNIEVLDAKDSVAGLQLSGKPCCATSFINVTSNSFGTGPVPVDIEGSTAGTPNGIYFNGLSAVHPAPGLPNIKCNDTSMQNNTTVWIAALYEEGAVGDTKTPLNQITGCGQVTVMGEEIKSGTANSLAPAWSVSNAAPTSLQILGSSQILNFALPATVVVYNAVAPNCPAPPCTVVTDNKGSKGFWSSN